MAAKKSAIDVNLIRELANLLNDTDLNEIELEEGETRLRLSRGTGDAAPQYYAPAPVAAPAPVQSVTVDSPAAAPAVAPSASGTPVPSPMVGTTYLAPAPGADNFIKVGDTVKAGQTILIVEAMKTMNQIPCSQDGVVASIDVEDGQPVEFGQTLITLK